MRNAPFFLSELETSFKRAEASLLSFADPALNPMRVVAPALRSWPIGGSDATCGLGSLLGAVIFGAAGTVFFGTTFSGAGGGKVIVFTGFFATAVGFGAGGTTGAVGTGTRAGAESFGADGAGIAFGGVKALGGANGRIWRGAGARRAVRVILRAGFRAFLFVCVVRLRIALGGRRTMPPDLAEERPVEITGNLGCGDEYRTPRAAAAPGTPSSTWGTFGERPKSSITL